MKKFAKVTSKINSLTCKKPYETVLQTKMKYENTFISIWMPSTLPLSNVISPNCEENRLLSVELVDSGVLSPLQAMKLESLHTLGYANGESCETMSLSDSSKARFSVYKDVSDQIRNIFYEYTDLVEPMSLDEAYLDVSSHPLPATQIASEIKEKIKQQTGLTASAGVAPSKMVAKIASDMQKPNGLTVVAPERVFTFMQPLALKKIPGIGPVTNSRLADQGYIFCHDIISEDAKILERKFGQKQAQWLIRKAQELIEV